MTENLRIRIKIQILTNTSVGLPIAVVCLLLLFNPVQTVNDSICYTKSCNDTANLFLLTMNRTVDPCDDFYQFTCRSQNFNPTNFGQDVYSDYRKFDTPDPRKLIKSDEPVKPFRLLKTYFNSCTDSDENKNLETFSNILSELGFDLGLVDGRWTQKGTFDWINTTKVLIDRGLLNNFRSFLPRIEIKPTAIDSYKPIITFGITVWFINNKRSHTYFKTNDLYISKFLADYYNNTNDDIDIEKLRDEFFEHVFDFHYKFLDIVHGAGNGHTRKIQIKKLEQRMPAISWHSFIQTVLSNLSNKTVSENTIVAIENPKMMRNLENLISNTSNSVLLSYMAYTIHTSYRHFMDKDFNSTVSQCTYHTSLPDILPVFLSSKAMTPEDKWKREYILELSQKIKRAFRKIINDEWHWMDRPTKMEAIEKLEALYVVIVHTHPKTEMEHVLQYYGDFELDDRFGYWSVLLQIATLRLKRQIDRFPQSLDFIPQTLPTWNRQSVELIGNMIYINLGDLRNIVVKMDRPDFLNFISVGWDIAQNMASLLIGKSQHGSAERQLPWSSDSVKQKQNLIVACFVKSYLRFNNTSGNACRNIFDDETLDMISRTLTRTLGFQVIHFMFKEWAYRTVIPQWKFLNSNDTLDQMFFISAGLQYCGFSSHEYVASLKYTFKEIVRNFREFGNVFSCEANSRMNPSIKCRF